MVSSYFRCLLLSAFVVGIAARIGDTAFTDPVLDGALLQSIDTVLLLQWALKENNTDMLDIVMQDVSSIADMWEPVQLPQPDLTDGVNTPEGWQVGAAPLVHLQHHPVPCVVRQQYPWVPVRGRTGPRRWCRSSGTTYQSPGRLLSWHLPWNAPPRPGTASGALAMRTPGRLYLQRDRCVTAGLPREAHLLAACLLCGTRTGAA